MINTNSSLTAEINRQQALAQQIAQLQSDISTQKKVNVASDDPAAAARIAVINRTQADQAVYSTNINTASAVATAVDTNLASVTTSLTQLKEIMLQASNGTMSDSDRASAVTQLKSIQSQIASYAATTDSSGNAIFSKSTPIQIPISAGQTVAASDSYDEVFGGVTLKDGSTTSIDDIVNGAISALQTTDATARSAAVATSLTSIDAASTHISSAQSDIGIRETQLNNATESLATSKINLSDERSGLEDTDLTAAAAQLSQKMTVLSAAQSVLAELSKTSLFDKLG